MNKTRKLLFLSAGAAAIALSTLAAVPTVRAEEWPQWRGPRGDLIVKGDGLAAKWPADGPRRLWEAPVGLGYASPIGVGGKVYAFGLVGNNETLTAIDAATGQPAWAQSYAIGNGPDYAGTRATPLVEANRIYTYGGTGVLTARNLADGAQVWQVDVLKEAGSSGGMLTWGQASSPLIVGNALYVQGGKDGHVAIAVDKNTGKSIWKSEAKGVGGYAQIIQVDVAGKPQLAVFGGKAVYGMDPATGKTLWQQEWVTSYDVNAATPLYRAPHLLVSSGYSKGSLMLELSAAGAKKVWSHNKLQCKFQPPILDGDTVYAVSEDKRGMLKAVKWPTGDVLWEANTPKLGFGGSIVRVGKDRIIAQAQEGKIYLFGATLQKGEVISEFEAFAEDFKEHWATPLVYQGKLYAKGKDKLVAFDISGK